MSKENRKAHFTIEELALMGFKKQRQRMMEAAIIDLITDESTKARLAARILEIYTCTEDLVEEPVSG